MDKLFFVVAAAIALIFGFFIYKKPREAFKIQKRFYASINWNLDPISLEKEVRNTKVMGISVIIFVVLAGLYMCFR